MQTLDELTCMPWRKRLRRAKENVVVTRAPKAGGGGRGRWKGRALWDGDQPGSLTVGGHMTLEVNRCEMRLCMTLSCTSQESS